MTIEREPRQPHPVSDEVIALASAITGAFPHLNAPFVLSSTPAVIDSLRRQGYELCSTKTTTQPAE